MASADTTAVNATKPNQVSTYSEIKVGKTLFRVTNIYKGEIDLAKTLERLIVEKVLASADTASDQ